MEFDSTTLFYFMILFALIWMAFIVIPRFIFKKAVLQVIHIFRQSHSRCSESPKTINEIGLGPRGLVDSMLKLKDYRPYALQFLIHAGVVRLKDDEKVCLLEEKVPEFMQANNLT